MTVMPGRQTWGVLAACVALLAAAAGAALLLMHSLRDDDVVTWEGFRTTSKGLAVRVSYGGCAEISGTELRQNKQRVTVTVLLRDDTPWYGYCSEQRNKKTVRVRLADPLQQRQVYDGVCLATDAPRRDCRHQAQQ